MSGSTAKFANLHTNVYDHPTICPGTGSCALNQRSLPASESLPVRCLGQRRQSVVPPKTVKVSSTNDPEQLE